MCPGDRTDPAILATPGEVIALISRLRAAERVVNIAREHCAVEWCDSPGLGPCPVCARPSAGSTARPATNPSSPNRRRGGRESLMFRPIDLAYLNFIFDGSKVVT